MFSMRLANAGHAAALFRAVAAVVDEATFRATDESIGLVSMDPAHVSLVDFELYREAAEEYRADGGAEITIDVREVLRFLKRARKDEALTLQYDGEKKRLSIIIEDPTGSRVRSYQLNTLDMGHEPLKTPSLNFKARAVVSTEALWEAVEDAGLVADHLEVTIRPEGAVFRAENDEGVAAENVLPEESLTVYKIEAEGEASAKYSYAYLERIVGAARGLSDTVAIELSPKMPIRLSFPIYAGRLQYLLAPMVD
jgi:proliferating cell nuclear antigen